MASASAQQAVLAASEAVPAGTPVVRGYDFPARGPAGTPPPPVDYQRLLECMATTGFQASAFGAAVVEVRRMLAWRLSDEPVPPPAEGEEALTEEEVKQRAHVRCKVRARGAAQRRLRPGGPGRALTRGGSRPADLPGLHQQPGLLRRAREHPIPGATQDGGRHCHHSGGGGGGLDKGASAGVRRRPSRPSLSRCALRCAPQCMQPTYVGDFHLAGTLPLVPLYAAPPAVRRSPFSLRARVSAQAPRCAPRA